MVYDVTDASFLWWEIMPFPNGLLCQVNSLHDDHFELGLIKPPRIVSTRRTHLAKLENTLHCDT